MDIQSYMHSVGRAARAASRDMAKADTRAKNDALLTMAQAVERDIARLLDANRKDVEAARAKKLGAAMVDRLTLTPKSVASMAEGLRQIAALPDPVGEISGLNYRPTGIQVGRMRVPLGVIGIIYEARPNVTADAAGLCLKSGNAAILRGGSEAINSNQAIGACVHEGLRKAGLPETAVQVIETTDRAAVGELITMKDYVDIIVPRGGKGLIERVAAESRIPVIMHLEGNNHTYIDGDADPEKARKILVNAKMRRTGVCGATETLLLDTRAKALIPVLIDDLIRAGCEVRGDVAFQAADNRVKPATDADWDTEYLDAIIAAKVVDGIEGAIRHVSRHGSKHTEAIVTENKATAERFLQEIDAAIVLWNASTQFADGGEVGMGAEIGISTGKLHARGPVGCEQLTSFKYLVRGTGQVRP